MGRILSDMDSDKVDYFRPDDEWSIRAVETFAKQAAIAMTRSKLVAEREQLRTQLVRTTQLVTAGSIASSLAHELKNGLMAISTLAQGLEPDPAMKLKKENIKRLTNIEAESRKLSALAGRLAS